MVLFIFIIYYLFIYSVNIKPPRHRFGLSLCLGLAKIHAQKSYTSLTFTLFQESNEVHSLSLSLIIPKCQVCSKITVILVLNLYLTLDTIQDLSIRKIARLHLAAIYSLIEG